MNILKTAWIQSKVEMINLFKSFEIILQLGSPVFMTFIMSIFLVDLSPEKVAIIQGVVLSAITSYGALCVFGIHSACYTERLGGNFVRIRTLPNGTVSWMIGHLMFQIILFLISMMVALVSVKVFLPVVELSIPLVFYLLVITMLGVIAFAPVGFVIGMLARSLWLYMLGMVVNMALFIGTSGIVPFSAMPAWVGYVSLISPFYWMGYAGRALSPPAEAGVHEVFGVLNPALAIGVLVVLAIIGWMIGPRLVQDMMRKETIGQLGIDRQKTMALQGL